MSFKWFLLIMVVAAAVFIGCGSSPLGQTLNNTDQWNDQERGTDYRLVKKDYATRDWDQTISRGTQYVARYSSESDQDVEEVQYLVGDSYYQQTKYEEAIQAFTKVTQNYPYSPYRPLAMLGIGNCCKYSEKHGFDEAVVKYQAFLTEYSDHSLAADAQLGIGECKYRKASEEVEFETAITELQKVLMNYELHGNSATRKMADYYLGKSYEERPQATYEVAIKYYKDLAENDSTYLGGDTWYRIGVLYQEKLNKIADAKAAYYTVITHYPYCTYYNEARNRYYCL
ncbi:MAG: tetratricopeptide repeat protein [Candidatus Wallbacteria bacterium]|nr:tetratricopeptide repeat protein [Candidatus Wallbacteria bacterium]